MLGIARASSSGMGRLVLATVFGALTIVILFDFDGPGDHLDGVSDEKRQQEEDCSHYDEIEVFDLLDLDQLQRHVAKERYDLEKRLQKDYGRDYFYRIFYDSDRNSRGKRAFYTSKASWDRSKQRMQAKVLQVQRDLLSGTCRNGSPPKLVYVAAGHSSAAGHGNYESESYAAVLERAVKPVFASIGITFEARNYGMTAMTSAPELALCFESVYGTDVDVVSWDFGLTDGPKQSWMLPMFLYRAAYSPGRPILLALELKEESYRQMLDLDRRGELSTSPLLAMNNAVVREMFDAVPDSLGKRREQLDAMPEMIRYLKCGRGGNENRQPCEEHKWSTGECPDRWWKKSWHPGYKRLAVRGNLLALLFVDLLQEAVYDLRQRILNMRRDQTGTTLTLEMVQEQLLRLQEASRERSEKQQQQRRPLSGSSEQQQWLPLPLENGTNNSPFDFTNRLHDLRPEWIYKSPAFCRTAKLPSQIRYKGILTGRSTTAQQAWDKTYDPFFREGTERQEIGRQNNNRTSSYTTNASTATNTTTPLALGYDIRNRQTSCNVTLNIDHMDFFYVTTRWTTAQLPSEREHRAYYSNHDNNNIDEGKDNDDDDNNNNNNQRQAEGSATKTAAFAPRGAVVICPVDCTKYSFSGGCLGDELRVEDMANALDVTVNGVKATVDAEDFGFLCKILAVKALAGGGVNNNSSNTNNANGNNNRRHHHLFPMLENEYVELSMRIDATKTRARLLQISSIIII